MRVVLRRNSLPSAKEEGDDIDLCDNKDLDLYFKYNPDGIILVENAKCGKSCGAAESAISEIAEALELPVNILSFGKTIDCPALSASGNPVMVIHKGGKIEKAVYPADTVWENRKIIEEVFPVEEE